MKKAAKAFISGFIVKIIPLWFYKILLPRKVTSIFYHVVSDEKLAHIENIYPVISINQFRNGLSFISNHYDFVGYEEIESAYENSTTLPKRAVHLTFDDGFFECYSVIRPILLELGIPATFFITTDFIGNEVLFSANLKSLMIDKVVNSDEIELLRFIKKLTVFQKLNEVTKQHVVTEIRNIDRHDYERMKEFADAIGIDGQKYLNNNPIYLSDEEILEMHSEGFTIGSHTRSHYKLGLIDEKLMEEEIIESTKIIMKLTGQKTVPFAFPNSGYGVSRDKLASIRKNHPALGLIFDSKGFNQDAEFIVNRVWGEHPDFIIDKTHHRLEKILHNAYQEAYFIQLGEYFRG